METYVSHTLSDNVHIVRDFLNKFPNPSIVLVFGEMGSGKTTFIKSICEALGADSEVTSPTFSLVNEYKINNGKVYHFDLYRLKSPMELLDIGFEEYVWSGAWCFIEWPEIAIPYLGEKTVQLKILVQGSDRMISFG